MIINIDPMYGVVIVAIFFLLIFITSVYRFRKMLKVIKGAVASSEFKKTIVVAEKNYKDSNSIKSSVYTSSLDIKTKIKEFILTGLKDKSWWFLLFSNVSIFWYVMRDGQSLQHYLLIMWVQCLIIGIFNVIRILRLREFSTKGLKSNGQQMSNTLKTKYEIAVFFLIHYGMFLWAVLTIFVEVKSGTKIFNQLLIPSLILFVNHLFSFVYNAPRDSSKQNIGTLMFYPYARVVPMFFAPFFLVFGVFGVFIFKTIVDLLAHSVERLVRKGEVDKSGSGL